MIIQDADRFGLSQLHQLRGRIGRGERDGEAYLITASNSPEAKDRLSIMEKSSDGFELAEEDLRIRREGDVLGIRQHGRAALRLVQVIRDREVIQQAHTEALALLQNDPTLEKPEHALLAWELRRFTENQTSPDTDSSVPDVVLAAADSQNEASSGSWSGL
jgi:ATP-dependent DNA helicase RecG